MAIEPIKGFYVHDETTDTDGVAKYDAGALENLDRSLTERYRAPDSKAVGDRFSAVEEVADEANEIAKRLNEGGLELKDEVLAENISAWLSEHPEATTTVEDGALTQSKLSDSLDARKPSFYSAVSEMQEDEQLRLGTTAISDGAVYTARSAVEVNDPEDMVDPSVLYKYDGQYYNGGLTEDDRQIATGYECVNGFAVFVADYKNAYVTPEMFGAKGDGVADDTRAWQKAVDVGLPVIAKSKQYKCGTINVTKNIFIDCNWAEFVCIADRLFYCKGKVTATLTGESDYVADQAYTIGNSNYSNYTGFAMLKGTNNFELSRTYYLGGFVCSFDKGAMCGTYPINATSVTLELVTPITVHISNIGGIIHETPRTTTHSIEILYGRGCAISNATVQNGSGYILFMLNCCANCTLKNLNVHFSFTSNSNNSYIVSIANSSFCTVENSYLYNEKWHCWTTGDQYLCYKNIVKDSEMYSGIGVAMADHENGYGTTVLNVRVSGIELGALCYADNVTVLPIRNSYKNCLFNLCSISDEKNAVYNVKNVVLRSDGTMPSSSYVGMWLKCSPQVTGNTYYFSEVNLTNIKQEGYSQIIGDIRWSLPSTSNFVIKNVTIDNTNMYMSNMGVHDNNVSYVDFSNYCLIVRNVTQNNVGASAGLNTVGYSNMNFNELRIENCKLHGIFGKIKNLYFSNVFVDQSMPGTMLQVSGVLAGNGLHSRFSEEVLVQPDELQITDMRRDRMVIWFNITRASDGKRYYQRNVSGTMTVNEITV